MPPNPPGMKKKKKGPAPAHQNKFAFKHNPKSKTTEKILSSPNIHVCRRCHDKIEWRKQYRKYKPRTQPGTCNECQKRNVLAAYHTICESCTRVSIKAQALMTAALENEEPPAVVEGDETGSPPPTTLSNASKLRACAVCVKELALPDPEEDEEEKDLADQLGRIRLRERKAIERKLEQEAREARKARRLARQKDEEGDDDDDDHHDQKSNEDPAASDVDSDQLSDDEDDDDDPFLKAVGGADKLLTGEAYQAKLLEQMQRSDQSET